MLRRILFFALGSIIGLQAYAGTTGAIRGVIRDKEKNEVQAGITVIATSPSFLGQGIAITNEAGEYLIENLTPGIYSVTAEFAKASAKRGGINVSVDKTLNINLEIPLGEAGQGETYVILDKPPNVDVATSTVGRTLTQEFIERVPFGRGQDFSGLLRSSPSATDDDTGIAFGGATGLENNYVIDGFNATGMTFGTLNAALPKDFIEEFEVKEGGYGPEYGRATGGFVNVVTKGGSNEFHGSVFAHYRAGFLAVAPKRNEPVGSIVGTGAGLDYYLNAGFEVGGPIVKDLLWFHAGYAPEITQRPVTRTFRWFADVAGVQQLDNFGDPIYASSGQLLDGNGNLAEAAQTDNFSNFTHVHQYTFKLSHLINDNHRHSVALRGAPSFYSGNGGVISGDPSQNSWTNNDGNFWSAVYTYNGKFLADRLKLDATLGALNDRSTLTPTGPKSTDALLTYSNVMDLRDVLDQTQSTLPIACLPANDILDGNGQPISRCQVNGYSRGGFGAKNDRDQIRFAEKIALTGLVQFAGLHQFKAGIDFEQNLSKRNKLTYGQPGGELVYTAFRPESHPAAYWVGQGYSINGVVVPGISPTVATFNYGVFGGDTWNPISNLTLNYGLRWEGQSLYGAQDVTAQSTLNHKFSIWDNIAPRAGFVWDFTNQGKGALRFNYGRYYESIPSDILDRGFAGEQILVDYRWRSGCKASGYDPNTGAPINPLEPDLGILEVTNPYLQCEPIFQDLFGGTDSLVAPGLKGQYSDEFILSADYEPIPTWIFGVTAIYRYLGNVIEDVSTDGGNTYLIANPGRFDISYLDDVAQELGRTTDQAQRDRLNAILATAPAINTYPRPTRSNWQLQFKVDKKLSDNFVINASYVLSWTYGNYPGLFSPSNGQANPNASSQFDLPQLVVNHDGFLPQDQRHNIKVSGYYRAAMKDFGVCIPLAFNLGAALNANSGGPYEVLGNDELYGTDEVFILPRGAGGRLPWVWTLDLNVGAEWAFDDQITLEIFSNLFNVNNNQQTLSVDQTYTFSQVRPIVDGDSSQLQNLRDVNGDPVVINPNYGNPTSYLAGFGAQFGARLKF